MKARPASAAAALLLAGAATLAAAAPDAPPGAGPNLGAAGAAPDTVTDDGGLAFDGSARVGWFGRSRTLDGQRDMLASSLWLHAKAPVPDGALVAEGWLRNDRSLRSDSPGGQSSAELREGYWSWSRGSIDLRVGQQIIAWGRADEINPTDRLTPRDYTLLVPERSDQRLGLPAVKATRYFDQLALTAIWMPGSRPNVLPLQPIPGISYETEVARHAPQGALKLERSGGEVDWSVSWFHGRDTDPDLSIGAVGPTGVHLKFYQPRVDVLGFDMATAVGGVSLRAEAAYSIATAAARDDPLAKNSNLFAVFGGDWDVAAGTNINLQYIVRSVADYTDPRAVPDPLLRQIAVQQAVITGQLDRFQHGMSVRIARRWLNDTLRAEILGVYSFTYRDFALRPKLSYAVTDRWKVTVGADLFRGDELTYFGRVRDLSMAYAEVSLAF